jgi:hypothetical protein
VFSAMGGAITVLAVTNLVLGVVLLFQRIPNRVVGSGIRFGLLVSFAGMMIAYLMTVPTVAQLEAARAGAKIHSMGAHSVGVSDGGPGLPFLGWSTEGGDLRAPHFVGIHGMQVLVALGLLLTLPALRRRFGIAQRVALVRIGGVAYAGWFGLLTWQALRGQSVVSPDRTTLVAYAVLIAATVGGVWWVVQPRRGRDSAELGFERDELLPHRAPLVAEQSEGFVLNSLPESVGTVVGRDSLRCEARVSLAPIVVASEVDHAVANERADVAADRRGVAPHRVGQVAERHASCDPKRGEDGPLRAPDSSLAECLVVGGRDGATRAAHSSANASHRRHHVQFVRIVHSLYMHHCPEIARCRQIGSPKNLDAGTIDSRCKCK